MAGSGWNGILFAYVGEGATPPNSLVRPYRDGK
jgi:hypothetical protein